MKKKWLIIPCFLLLACGAHKPATTATLTSECPKNGTCTTELMKNKSMAVKKDEFGRTYYTLEDHPDMDVIKFSYNKTVKGDIQDAGYREEVVFEWNEDRKSISDASLQNTKMLFGRFCYCKGQTGYYKITKGKLAVTSQIKGRILTLNFKTEEVPQIIDSISILLK